VSTAKTARAGVHRHREATAVVCSMRRFYPLGLTASLAA
jgi:hypothetical protein